VNFGYLSGLPSALSNLGESAARPWATFGIAEKVAAFDERQGLTLLRQIEVGIANGKATPQPSKEALAQTHKIRRINTLVMG